MHLGYFRDKIDAAEAYDDAARKYYKEFARLNFPPAGNFRYFLRFSCLL